MASEPLRGRLMTCAMMFFLDAKGRDILSACVTSVDVIITSSTGRSSGFRRGYWRRRHWDKP